MADHREITVSVVHMRQWRIVGSDSAIEATITACQGESVTLDYGARGTTSMNATLAGSVGECLVEAARFVSGGS